MENLIQRSPRPSLSARIRRLTLSVAALTALHFLAGTGQAGVVFYATPADFTAGAGSATVMGSENWSSAGNAAEATVPDPLAPGVANGPFPSGTSVAAGISVQSNSRNNAPVSPSPGQGLFYAPTGYTGTSGNKQPSNQVSANFQNNSLDVIFSTVAGTIPGAVSLTPTYYQIGTNVSGTVTIQVYNQTNAFLGSTTVSNVQDCLDSAFIGIVTTGSDTLGRVNLWASTTDIVGVDNISVYGAAVAGGASRLHALTLGSSGFSIQIDGAVGQTFRFLASTDLTSWVPVQTNTLTSASQQFTLPASGTVRFYQAQQLP